MLKVRGSIDTLARKVPESLRQMLEQQITRLPLENQLHRLMGELLLQQAVPDTPQAETCLHQALAVSRRQQAKSLELRAATSLARLWQQQGQRAEARALLAPIYRWFTEGFETADLQEAKVLLNELEA